MRLQTHGNRLIEIVHNGQRHSFATYLMAILKNASDISIPEKLRLPGLGHFISKSRPGWQFFSHAERAEVRGA